MMVAAVAADAVTEGGLYMWGSNAYGALGDGTTTGRSSPVQVGSDTTWTDVDGGQEYTFATKTDETLWSWGYGNNFRNGLANQETNISSPVQINDATDWGGASLGGGRLGAAVVKADGTLWVWGRSPPDGQYEAASSPIQIGSLTDWSQVSEGLMGGHAVKTDGTLWVWGYSDDGIAGIDPFPDGADVSPVQIGSLTDWKHVGRSRSFTVAMATKTDGTLWGWAVNTYGVLGQGNTTTYSFPVQVGSLTDWDTVECGHDTMYALKTDGTIWSCGEGGTGALGDSTLIDKSSPVQIGSATDWVQISAGKVGGLARTSSGTIYSWGTNTSGELGLGDRSDRSSPSQIGSETDWVHISFMSQHAGGIRE